MKHVQSELDKLSVDTVWDLLVAITNAINELDKIKAIEETYTPQTKGYQELMHAQKLVFDLYRLKHNQETEKVQQQNQ